MSLTSYRTAPSRDALFWAFCPFRLFPFSGLAVLFAPSGVYGAFVSSLRDTFWCLGFYQVWRRPTLPRLETQYHWRDGTYRPGSGWDRVFCSCYDHQTGKNPRHILFVLSPFGYLRTFCVLPPGGLLEDVLCPTARRAG